uniref:Uncharacterized protein n=2 Tax=Caenorhabditis japonica TaxID=281687 RepID=A0A8R1HKC0_CAEJA
MGDINVYRRQQKSDLMMFDENPISSGMDLNILTFLRRKGRNTTGTLRMPLVWEEFRIVFQCNLPSDFLNKRVYAGAKVELNRQGAIAKYESHEIVLSAGLQSEFHAKHVVSVEPDKEMNERISDVLGYTTSSKIHQGFGSLNYMFLMFRNIIIVVDSPDLTPVFKRIERVINFLTRRGDSAIHVSKIQKALRLGLDMLLLQPDIPQRGDPEKTFILHLFRRIAQIFYNVEMAQQLQRVEEELRKCESEEEKRISIDNIRLAFEAMLSSGLL